MTEQQFKLKHPDALDTDAMTAKYHVLGFSMGYVAVIDRQTGDKGSLNFTHSPRFYYDFVKT